MAEYIERKTLMKFPIRRDHCDKEHANEHFINGIETVMEYAENLPTVDAVIVVRCRDCIHYNESKRLCCVSGWVHDEDGFCNLGERRTEMEDWEFFEERYRMCKSFDKCADGCPAFDDFCTVKNEFLTDKGIEIVKEWSATHPRKTRQSALLELFRNVKLDDNGIVDIDTCKIEKYRAKFCPRSKNCSECRRAFWSEEIVL